LESYREFENYPGPDIPGVRDVANWLEHNRPSAWTPGIMHGDYHAANVMFSRSGPDVVAIVDWEMCTVGDPLLDLGWLLATWRQPDESSVFGHSLTKMGGLASPQDLIERYARNTTRDLSHITWYTVLACFKLGIVLEGTLARASVGKAQKEVGDYLHAITLHLFEQAQTLMGGAATI
jgi:aminoglycoside phosphotransferase (APT) family kinase protein